MFPPIAQTPLALAQTSLGSQGMELPANARGLAPVSQCDSQSQTNLLQRVGPAQPRPTPAPGAPPPINKAHLGQEGAEARERQSVRKALKEGQMIWGLIPAERGRERDRERERETHTHTERKRDLVTWNRGPAGNPATENLRVVSFPLKEVLEGSECKEGEYRSQSKEKREWVEA